MSVNDTQQPLTVGLVARASGVKLDTIRFYERQGLLPRPPRTASGYRTFPPETVRRVRFIKRAQALGFTLKEIRELLALRVAPQTTCATVRRRAEAKLAEVEGKLRDLKAMERALRRLAATCSGRGPASTCPILECLESGEGLP